MRHYYQNQHSNMNTLDQKEKKYREFIYTVSFSAMILVIAAIFLYSTKFITIQINSIFTQDNQATIETLNRTHYSLIEKKLHLTQNKLTTQ